MTRATPAPAVSAELSHVLKPVWINRFAIFRKTGADSGARFHVGSIVTA
jgi:hypothetical protein